MTQNVRRDLLISESLESGDLAFVLDPRYMDLPDTLFVDKAPQIERAFTRMAALEAGAIENPDEGRMVGHYWLRDADRAPTPALRETIRKTVQEIVTFAKEVHERRILVSGKPVTNFLVVGIGGSALGPQLASFALGNPASDRVRPFFLDNTDPQGIDHTLAQIAKSEGGLAGTLVIITSKSGGTKETRNGQLEVKAAFARAGLSFVSHAVAVTGEGSELYKTATGEGWLKIFPMWDWVGGRTSELSAVGLLPAALQGIDILAMLSGAAEMDRWTRRYGAEGRKNPALVLALCFQHAASLGRRDMVVLPYKDRLELFSRYLQQLVMESLGKEKDLQGTVVNQGIAVYGNKGSTDQHAYVQQLRDGMNNFFAVFIEVLKDRDRAVVQSDFVEDGVTSGDYLLGFLLGTRRALHDKDRLSLTLTIPEVSPYTLGMLIALFERAVGFYASFCNINAYHQPGVEAGKVAAASVLKLQGLILSTLCQTGQTAAELAALTGGDEETAWKLLEHLYANGRIQRIAPEKGESPLSARFLR